MHSIHVGFENAHLRAPDFPAGFRVRPFVRSSVQLDDRSSFGLKVWQRVAIEM